MLKVLHVADEVLHLSPDEEARPRNCHGRSWPMTLRDAASEPARRVPAVAVIVRGQRLLVIRRAASVVGRANTASRGAESKTPRAKSKRRVRELREELGGTVRPVRRLWQSVTPCAWRWHGGSPSSTTARAVPQSGRGGQRPLALDGRNGIARRIAGEQSRILAVCPRKRGSLVRMTRGVRRVRIRVRRDGISD